MEGPAAHVMIGLGVGALEVRRARRRAESLDVNSTEIEES